MYKCLKCPIGFGKNNIFSCSDTSRHNLKKHIEVSNIANYNYK